MNQKQFESKDTEEFYRLAFNLTDDLIAIIEPNYDFQIKRINDENFENYLSYAPRNLYNNSFLKLIHPEHVQNLVKILKRGDSFSRGGKEIVLIDKNQDEKWFEIKVKEFKDKFNEKNLFVKLRPIFKRKILESKIEESKNTLKKITEKIPEIRFWKLFSPEKFEDALESSYEMLEMIIESIPQYIFWKDNNRNYLGCNKNYAKFIGIDFVENIIGKKDKDLIEKEKKRKELEKHEKAVINSGKEQYNSVEEWETKQGKIIFNVNRIPLIDKEKGESLGILVSYDDITDRKNSEQELKESEQKFRTITEQSLMGILIMQDFDIKYINDKLLEIIDYTREEVLNWHPKEFFKLIHPDDIQKLKNKINQKCRGDIHIIENLQFRLISKTGKISWVEILSKTITYNGEEADLDYIIDISEKKKAEQELKKSEKKYRSLLKTSTVGILEIDVNKKMISYINPRLLDILGYSREEISMELIKKILHPNDYTKIYGDLEEKELEIRIFNKDGEKRWLSGKRIRQYDEEGKLSSVRQWLDDVTEKKTYERLITELNINFLNFTVDIQKNIQMLLNTCIKLLGGKVALYIQKNEEDDQIHVITSDSKTYTYHDSEEFQKNFFGAEFFKEEHDFPQTIVDIKHTNYIKTDPIIQNYDINGAYGKLIKSEDSFSEAICILFSEKPTISHEHQLILFLIADAIEIEHRRWEVKEFLEDQNQMLNEMNKLKSELLTRTSHELKTPLISIKGFTELLLQLHSNKMDSDMVSIVEGIMDGAKRMEKIINTLIKTSKLNQNILELKKTREDLGFLIKFCIEDLKGLITLRDHSIEYNLENNLITKFDKERIYEVLSNFLVNAVKFTPPGGKIKITSKLKNNSILTAVQDTGVGLTKDEKLQLFKQFGKIERYGKGWDVGIEGSGLGLYISKKIVELHGGKIWVESEGRNKGSTFYFTLPLK